MSSRTIAGRISGKFRRGAPLTFIFEDNTVNAFAGESVAAALIASGLRATRDSPSGLPRGPFCFIGSCQECAVRINGRKVLACKVLVAPGLAVSADKVQP